MQFIAKIVIHNVSSRPFHFLTTTRNITKVSVYLQRANLIDSIRLCLHANSPKASLVEILSNILLDSFVVANALRSAPSPASALAMIEALKEVEHFTHSQHTLHALAKILAKSGQTGRLKALIGAMDAGKFGKKVGCVGHMDRMRWFADTGDLDEVKSVWDEWRRELDERPCVESYNIVMKVCVEKGMDEDAVRVFYRMVEEGAVPNSRTYTIVMSHLIRLGKAGPAMEVFRMLPRMRIKRTVKQYSMLVEAFSNADEMDVVKALLDEMRADGILPGRAMRTSLERMKVAGYVNETEGLIREMMPDERVKSISYAMAKCDEDVDEDEEDNIEEVRLKPWLDPVALACALRYWEPEEVMVLKDANLTWTSRLVCKLIRSFKSAETAWRFFRWVAHQPGFVHDVYTTSRMVTKLTRHGHTELAERLLLKLDREGMKLSFATVRLIIDFYGYSKKGDAALSIFRKVKTICGFLPNTSQLILYSSLLRTLAKCEMDIEAMEILDEMFLMGISPDSQTITGLMHHYATQGDVQTVQRLFGMAQQGNVEMDAYTYKIVICAYCKHEWASLAIRVFEDMKGLGLAPDARTKEVLVTSLWKEGKLREASRVEEMSEDVTLASPGHLFRVSGADLERVRRIYSDGFESVITREEK